jgi:hypothetical protein
LEIAALVTSIVAALAAAVSSYVTFAARKRAAGVRAFREIREYLKQNRAQLVEQTLAYHAAMRHEQKIPLLSLPGWVQSSPTPLGEIELTLLRRQPNKEALLEAIRRTAKYWPRTEAGARLQKYSDAITAYDRPSLWQNRRSYRLLEVNPNTGPIEQPPSLIFSLDYYFDLIDTSEVLGFEAASRLARGRSLNWSRSYRAWLADPFALSRRCVVPGINVLTVRQSSKGAHFFLHDRRADNVALSMNAIHVTPAIEFQPSGELTASYQLDLDMWHTISTGYLREFLGITESGGTHGVAADPAYAVLEDARASGSVTSWFLGIGLDPLTWKPEILVACIFYEEAFDTIFASMVQRNLQGPLLHSRIGSPSVSGLPFSREAVSMYANDPGTLPAGRACLALAWQSRKLLAITESQRGS